MAQDESIVSGMAGRYASALFALAQEQKAVDKVGGDLDRLARMIGDSADLARLVKSPVFSAEAQTKAIGAVLDKAGIGGLVGNFVRLVAQKRRLFALGDMIQGFHKLSDAARGVTRAEVTVAEPLSDQHRAAVEDALKAITGGKSVGMNVKVDPAIIGGLVVKLGSRMYDGSLKTKLNAIRTRMKEVG
ncbi:MAG: F0F1 ATP synthase subunit delta [Hyphomicrobiaceae bacterium]|nr:F0F1 ATP synthase subunit delta [Hyphomicrobiaceae bacterium]